MAYQFKLQVPISEELNKKLKNKANEVGFSSVNEIARLLLTNFANGNLSLSFTEKPPKEELTISKELEAVIKKGISDYKKGKTKKLDFSKSIHEQLMED
ncbi:MAG: hypothetical protein KGO93_09835 [Cyanobacteria bacterium REEB446]|jgi:hypothetical protein|nr:hypothetical protein [Cyanobacteria bacterium REEB446]NBV99502.1 hypothetical protein [Pseudomonadota bacterium]